MRKLFKDKLLMSWAFYDFSNSSYVLIFQSFLLPVYFATVLQDQYGLSKFSWGLANGVSTLLGLMLAFLGGTYSDKNERLKVFKIFVFITFIFIVLFSLSVSSFPLASYYLFIVANSFFIATIALSDSLLKFISPVDKLNEYSGFAWGWGYIGGIVCLIMVMITQYLTSDFDFLVFLGVGFYYMLFSFIAIRGLSLNGKTIDFNPPKSESRLVLSISEKLLLLFGYWLIAESITIIILFYAIYASEELGLTTQIIGVTLLGVQFVGFFSTWYGGKLADKFGTTKLLGASIFIWIVVILLLVNTNDYVSLSVIVILTGLVIGNSQSYLRAQYTSIVEKHNIGFQFGFFALATQAAVIIGPIIYGYASDKLNSQKAPMLILILCLVLGFSIIHLLGKRIANGRVALAEE